MLKKNKDYVEFTLQYTSVDWERRSKDCPEVCLKGYSDFSFPGVPIMDVVCNEFDHKVVVVSKRDFEALQTENEQLKKKLNEFDPMPEFRELLKKLFSTEDVEKLEWTLNHICGGRASANGWIAVSSFWKQNYETLSKLVGFPSVEKIQDYLTNEAECDTLYGAISKLHDEVKYTSNEWKDMDKKLKAREKESKILTGALQEWKEATGYPTPIAAKTLIESGMAYEHGFHEAQEENRKLTDEVDSWKNVTGYSTPEDYMHARISGAFHTPFDYTAAWQKATGCDTTEAAKCRINNLIGEAEAWESDYNHLLALTGFDNEGEIEDFLEQNNDRNKLTTVVDNLKLENETMKTALRASNLAIKQYIEDWKAATCCSDPIEARKLYESHTDEIVKWTLATSCKTPEGAKSHIKDLEEGIRLLNRNMLKELDSEINEWQKATGRIDPEAAKQYIDRLKGRLNKIHRDSVDW